MESAANDFAPQVSVVIPTWNGGPLFRDVLAKLALQDLKHELVVIDSGSRDGTYEAARDAGATLLRIEQKTFNHGRARNQAIDASSGEIIALLTQDAEPRDAQWLRRLVTNYRDPRVAGVYARQVPRDDCSPLLKDRLQNWAAGRTQRIVQELASEQELAALHPMERLARCSFDDVSSSVRRSVWEELPFHERAFGEDVAWARRVLLAGHRIVFEPDAVVIHSHEMSTWYEFRRIYADHANLHDLFGVHTIPDRAALWRSFRSQSRHYGEVLAREIPGFWKRLPARLHSIPYAFLENLAQYLGARSVWKLRHGSRFYARLDRRLRGKV